MHSRSTTVTSRWCNMLWWFLVIIYMFTKLFEIFFRDKIWWLIPPNKNAADKLTICWVTDFHKKDPKCRSFSTISFGEEGVFRSSSIIVHHNNPAIKNQCDYACIDIQAYILRSVHWSTVPMSRVQTCIYLYCILSLDDLDSWPNLTQFRSAAWLIEWEETRILHP